MSGLELLAAGASVLGTAATVAGTVQQGNAANSAAQYEARQLEARGKEELAASQREAIQERGRAAQALSRQQALAAASGAGAGSDAPTIVKLMSDTFQQGEYNAGTALYGGQQRNAGMIDTARARRQSGKASLLGSQIGAFGQGFGGLGSLGMQYAKSGR